MTPIKVAVIDDNRDIRFVIEELLNEENDIVLCGQAENLDQARTLIKETAPDIILLDLSLEGGEGGLDFLKELPGLSPSTKAIMLSAYEADTHADRCLKAGASGYICKDQAVLCLSAAVRCVHSGKPFLPRKRE